MVIFRIICIYIIVKMLIILLAWVVSNRLTDYVNHFIEKVDEYSKKYFEVKTFFVPDQDLNELRSTLYTFATGFSELSKKPIIGGLVYFPILLINSTTTYFLLKRYEIRMDLASNVCDLMDKVSVEILDEVFLDDNAYQELRKEGNVEKLIEHTFESIMDSVRKAGMDESTISQVHDDFIVYWGNRIREQFNKKMMEA